MLDKARQGSAALLPPLFIASLLIVSLFLLVCSYLGDGAAFNSDDLLSTAQCDDLLHGAVTDWHLPGAPYLFPDLLLLLPCQLLAPTLPIVFMAYCLLLHLTLAATLVWLGRLSGLCWRRAIIAAGCGSLFLITLHLNKVMEDRSALLVHPGSHLAALVVGLFLLALTIHLLTRGSSWISVGVYLLIGSLGIFSDRLVVVQLLAPMGLALLLLAARRAISFKNAGIQLALLAGSFLLACILKQIFQRLGFRLLELETSSSRVRPADLGSMLLHLYQGVSNQYLLCALIPLHLMAALAVIGSMSSRSGRSMENGSGNGTAMRLAALTFVLSPPCILAALFMLGMSHHPAIRRYVLSIWFLPPLLLPLLMHCLRGKPARASAVALQAGILLFAFQRVWLLLPDLDRTRFEQPYPPLAQALDRLARARGPLNGLGSYWLARSTAWFTREKVTINPLSATGEPWFHACNPACFLPDGDLRIPSYQFVLVRKGDRFGPSAGVLALHYGTPVERIAVGGDEIWLYNSIRPPAFDRFLRSRLADRLHRQCSFEGPIEPPCLAKPKKSITPDDAPGTVALEEGKACEIRFAQPLTGHVLDVGANADARLDMTFFKGNTELGNVQVPSVPWTGTYYRPGLQSRLLPLPAVLRERLWDRILVRARADGENVRLGHVLVFDEDIPGLDEEQPLPHTPRVRLEAEEILPINGGMGYSEDASASGGRTRVATGDPLTRIIHTPRLFLPPGRYRLEAAMKVDGDLSMDEVASLLIGCLSPTKKLAELKLRGSDFSAPGRWITQQVTFAVPEDIENVQIGVVTTGTTPIRVDYLDLIAEPYP